MSRRPPPNTTHWRFLVRVFHEIAPGRWLKTASELASFANGRELRRSVDRELNFEQMAQLDQFLVDCLEQHIQDLDRRREAADNMIREIWRSGNERSPYCEIEKPVIFDESATERTLDELLVGDPLEAWKREFFGEELAKERAEREEVAA